MNDAGGPSSMALMAVSIRIRRLDSHTTAAPTTTRTTTPTTHHTLPEDDGFAHTGAEIGEGAVASFCESVIFLSATQNQRADFDAAMSDIVRLNNVCKGFVKKTTSIANKRKEIKQLSEPLKEDKDTIVQLMQSAGISSCTSTGMEFHLKPTTKKPTLTTKVLLGLFADFLNNTDEFQRFQSRITSFRETNTTTEYTLKTKPLKDQAQPLGLPSNASDDEDADSIEHGAELDEIFG
jgi:hypothetical protein